MQAAPQIITFCDNEELKEQWIKSNAELERVQKNLADYLETKRTAFARFYFLSNDELISILSQTKDPNAVQPHLRKCFEAVHAITMQGAECEMTEMISGEKARAPLHAAEPPSTRTLNPKPPKPQPEASTPEPPPEPPPEPHQERVPFMEPIYPRGSVEIWMGEIETMMRRSVRAVTEEGLSDY